jgi:hypothetical protein
MFRRIAAASLTAFLLVVAGGSAFAAPTTETHHEKGLVDTFTDVVPTCEGGGPLYEITTTSNLVEHVTTFANGRRHETFTQTGKFVAEPLDAGLPSYTGHFTSWGNFNQNGKTVNGTFTFNIHGTGSDGSTFKNHNNGHVTKRPNGSIREFFRCH